MDTVPSEWIDPQPGEPRRDPAANAQLAMTLETERLEVLKAGTK